MRLIKMDDHSAERSKETNENNQAAQFNYIRVAESSETAVSTSTTSNNMLSAQYLQIQRVPGDLVNASKNFSSLLNSNELLVDANGDLITSNTLDIPQEYAGDLIHDDLTDDDRRLAAALVAVQLVNQQKHQTGSHILPVLQSPSLLLGGSKLISVAESSVVNMPPLVGPNKATDVTCVSSSSMMASGVSSLPSYSQNTDTTTPMQPPSHQDHLLHPLKKVLNRSRYLQQDQSTSDSSIPLESLGIHTEMGPMDIDIKTPENIDFILPDDTEDSDIFDSDYDPSENTRRHSLPHKKRIPRRLRHPKKQAVAAALNPRNQAANRQLSQSSTGSFTCELCYVSFTNQWKFFEHLKSHYEVTETPLELETTPPDNRRSISQFQLNKEVSIALDLEPDRENSRQFLSRLRQNTPAVMVSPPRNAVCQRTAASNYRNAMPRLNPIVRTAPPRTPDSLRIQLPAANESKPIFSPFRSPKKLTMMSPRWAEDSNLTDLSVPSPSLISQVDMAPSPTVTLFQCHLCKRCFRRHKAYEVHMAMVHIRSEVVEEFSEPEDMMEGIRLQVASDDEDAIPEIREVGMQKGWCDSEDLYATEEDLTAAELKAAEEDLKFQTEVVHTEADLGTLSVDGEELTATRYIKVQKEETDISQGPIETTEEGDEPEPDIESVESRTCGLCDTVFPTRQDTNNHISVVHSDVMKAITQGVRKTGIKKKPKKGNMTCKECGRKFLHRNSLIYHLRSHAGDRAFGCETCGKSFFAKSALKVHLRQHSGAKPYKCEFCNKFFRQWGDLKYHVISIHSNQKNFQCEFCGKDFARKYSLTVHSRIHTGEKNYKCEYCEKSFRAASYLQNHRRVHTGEKPHKCEVCVKTFRVRSDMKRHMMTHKEHIIGTKVKLEPISNSNSTDSKCIPESITTTEVVQEEQLSLPDICKVEELEVNTVENILSGETMRASSRLQEINGTFTPREALDVQRQEGIVYFWQVFPS